MPVAPRRRPEEALVKLPVEDPPARYERLREYAFRRPVPMAEVVSEALREHPERAQRSSEATTTGRASD